MLILLALFVGAGALIGYFTKAPVWATATIGFWVGTSYAFFRTAYEYKKEILEHEEQCGALIAAAAESACAFNYPGGSVRCELPEWKHTPSRLFDHEFQSAQVTLSHER